MNKAADDIANLIHDAGDRLGDLKDASVKQLTDRTGDLVALIRQRPLLAVGIGLGAGYVLGRVFR